MGTRTEPVVTTVKNKCKRCYSCVRNCPAKAIRVEQGQAAVMEERCIACGNCYRVCAQNAKKIRDGARPAKELLNSDRPVVLILAPSFPAAFPGYEPGQIIAASKKLGFDSVMEVAFGAELVALEYRRYLEKTEGKTVISTPCPAVVKYVEKFHPALVPYLAPVVSPMVALARAIKTVLLPGAGVVFAGPCIAKKLEKDDPVAEGFVDAVLTFEELAGMFEGEGINPGDEEPVEFDGPAPRLGRLFPLSGGLIRTAMLKYDILEDEILVADGAQEVRDVLESIEKNKIGAKFFDLLLCEGGCINGPVINCDLTLAERKEKVSSFTRRELGEKKDGVVAAAEPDCSGVDLSCRFHDEHMELPYPSEEEIREILKKINKVRPEDELDCGACGYSSCREKAIAVYQGLAENEMCLPYIIDRLMELNEQIKRDADRQVIRAEKLASVGRLASGIAHEINNPLSGILLYASMLEKASIDDAQRDKLKTIIDETIRCRGIVKGVLDFSRQTEPHFGPVLVTDILERVFNLVEKQTLFSGIDIHKNYLEASIPFVLGDPPQIQQVFLNIIMNAAQSIDGPGSVSVYVQEEDGFLDVVVEDTGCGISHDDMDRIFEPFFTTKGEQKGTGLGLSTSHGIIENHGGKIMVESELGKGSKFIIRLPVMKNEEDVNNSGNAGGSIDG
ncbi:MAG TPA: [Fe-Fe] hydrogenase large subunit C-terminal domain-containing protein [bacterium]|nr:[Fe-Fe] hydrogenase large subunit C-terminal domain-containing protein [bacterium]